MNNKQVAHLWANKSRESATGSHFYFDGDTIYSYGSHFPIARHYKGVILFTSASYSNSTARHISIARMACSHLKQFTVAKVLNNPSREDVKNYREHIQYLTEKAAKARKPEADLNSLQREIDEANEFCETFKFKTRFELPDNWPALKEKARISAVKERKAKAAKQAKFEADCAELVVKWIAGEQVSLLHGMDKVYLRANQCSRNGEKSAIPSDAVMQTSKGPTVPLDEAHKTYRFATLKREKGWKRNGDQFKIGEFQLDAVNEFGVIAGCHRVSWTEIERFAKSQGWL